MTKVHIVILLSWALSVHAIPLPQHSRPSTSPTSTVAGAGALQLGTSQKSQSLRKGLDSLSDPHPSPTLQPSVMGSGAGERQKRAVTDNDFHTILPRSLNIGDTIKIVGEVFGGIKIHLLTKNKEIEAQLESDFKTKTLSTKSHNIDQPLSTDDYTNFVNDRQQIQLILSVSHEKNIEVSGWDGSYITSFSLQNTHKDIGYLHILGDIRKVHELIYDFA